jgi:phosphomannomutase
VVLLTARRKAQMGRRTWVSAIVYTHLQRIKFGTDGWRGLIADDFTFANVRIAAEAVAAYIHAQGRPAKGLCIGYDTRFGSKAFARACAEVVAATGIPVMLANALRPRRR